MTMATKNNTNKALQSELARAKKTSTQALIEWEIACNTNSKRGNTYNQSDIKRLYNRWSEHRGASKVAHLECHNGNKFEYIVIKRAHEECWVANVDIEYAMGNGAKKVTGNQLIDEINCWEELALTEDADLLCPILKYFKSKSDKVDNTSETMLDNNIIISQRAVKVGRASRMCAKAEMLNEERGYIGECADDRLEKMKALSDKMGWRDAMHNNGNSGVIFDYDKNCYKAVFIDYAL